MPRSLAMAVLMPIAGALYNRLGPRLLVSAGLFVSAVSFWDLAHLTSSVGFWDIFLPQLWQGVGFSLIFVALSTAAFAGLPRAKMTAAAGLYNVVRQVCGSVGIAVAASELTRGIARYHSVLAEHVTAYNPVARQWLQGAAAAMRQAGADAYTAGRQALDQLDLDVTRQAAVLSYNHVFALVAALFVIVLPLVLLLRPSRTQGDAPVPTD
jgi:DHA2 family multidrug resistance protein